VLADLQPDEKNRAKELIEDFMIAANGATVKYLIGKGFASLRRVLRSPERWGASSRSPRKRASACPRNRVPARSRSS